MRAPPRGAAYGLPAFGVAAPFFLIQFYFLNFATDVLLMAPLVVGAILAAGRFWDAVSDPLVGFWSDRTRTRLGRRRPWMLAAAPAVALAFLAVWSVPGELGPVATAAWVAVAMAAFTTAQTAWGIPHQALGAELSDDAHVRSRIFGWRYVAALLGAVCSFGGMQLIVNAPEPRAAAARLAALRDVLGNRHARRLLFVGFTNDVAGAAQGAVAPYLTLYILKRPDLIGLFPALYIVPLIASVPLWIRLARRFDRRRVWVVAMLGGAASYASLYWLQADDLVQAGLLLACAGFWTGCQGPLGPTLLAAVVDHDAVHTGERKEGSYFAAREFVEKVAGTAVVLVIAAALQVSGFAPNTELSPAAERAIRLCLAALPALMLAAGALALRGFALGGPEDLRP